MPIPVPWRRSLPVLAFVVLASGVAGAGEAKPGDIPVAPRALKLRWTLGGRLSAETDELQFRFKAYAGKMTVKTLVPSGAEVKKGDVLLALDPAPGDETVRDVELALEAAKLGAEAARIELEALEIQARAEQEKAGLRARKASEEKKIDAEQRWPLEQKDHELAIRRLEASIADQEKELSELEKMYKASELASDTKEIVLERARRELAITRDTLVQTQKRIRLEVGIDRPRRVVDIENESRWSAEDLDLVKRRQPVNLARAKNGHAQAEQALAKAREAEARIREDRKGFQLVAPRDGIVLHGSVDARWASGKATAPAEGEGLKVGDAVQPGQVLLTVLAAEPVQVALRVPEGLRVLVKKGTAAEVRFNALPGQAFKGSVASVVDLPDGAEGGEKTFSALVSLEAPAPALRPGLTASVELNLGDIADALVIPMEAVVQKAGHSYCRVRAGDKVEEREIVLGRWDGIDVQVVSGLKAGDVVVGKP